MGMFTLILNRTLNSLSSIPTITPLRLLYNYLFNRSSFIAYLKIKCVCFYYSLNYKKGRRIINLITKKIPHPEIVYSR